MKLAATIFLIASTILWSATKAQTITTDTDTIEATVINADKAAATDSVKPKKSFFKKFIDYFGDANKQKKRKRFDFSIIGGPHYSTDTKLGIGLVAAGLYRTNMRDTIMPPSNVSVFGDITTAGFYLLGIKGYHLFPADKYRIDYTLYFFSFPAAFWGVGYEMGNNNANATKLKRWQAQIKGAFLFKVADKIFMGPMATYDFVNTKKIDRPEILEGLPRKTINFGVGVEFTYDTRDIHTAPRKGLFINLIQLFRPKFLGNRYAFSTSDIRFCAYHGVWKGGVLAYEFRSIFNYGNTPWTMMASVGGSYSMRGYYEGRSRDNNKMDMQIELRQHVWRRNGVCLWVGAGTVFDKFSSIRLKHILPNFGIGYRWEFKKNVNVRLDYGFGKSGQRGFLFQINEAF